MAVGTYCDSSLHKTQDRTDVRRRNEVAQKIKIIANILD